MSGPRAGAAAVWLALAGCASAPPAEDDYLRWVSAEVPIHQHVLLRWPEHRMPLRVHLPRPPQALFADPDAILDSVRDGFLDWSDVVAPGVPRFRFVDDPGEAEIPVVWAAEPDGDWAVAFCAYDVQPFARRFGVSHLLVTARWSDGSRADLHDLHEVMLHEVGHALGLMGHSPDPGDVMFGGGLDRRRGRGLSARDRSTLRALYARPIGAPVVGARRFD